MVMSRREALKGMGSLAGLAAASRLLPGCHDGATAEPMGSTQSDLIAGVPYMERITSDPTWGTNWTHVVPGRWSSSSAQGLLLYDQAAGVGEFYATDGAGHRTLLQRYDNWRQSWSVIVPGYFSTANLYGNYSGVLLYDPIAGYVAVYSTDGNGNISVGPIAQKYTRTTWTHVVPGYFTTSLLTSLVLYSQSEGYAEVWTFDDTTGALNVVSTFDYWRTSWTHIVAGKFKDHDIPISGSDSLPCSDLFLYEGSTGAGQLLTADGSGGFVSENIFHGLVRRARSERERRAPHFERGRRRRVLRRRRRPLVLRRADPRRAATSKTTPSARWRCEGSAPRLEASPTSSPTTAPPEWESSSFATPSPRASTRQRRCGATRPPRRYAGVTASCRPGASFPASRSVST
jgi:hypothetical protein